MGYQDARDHVVASVDQFRAEPVLISFMADGAKDPARPAREIEAILQVSSYWAHGEEIGIDFLPDAEAGWLMGNCTR